VDTEVLTEKKCLPCEGDVIGLTPKRAAVFREKTPRWHLRLRNKRLEREFKFDTFRDAMNFVGKVGDLAEEEGHHPDIIVNYNKVRLDLTTHAIGKLSKNDFILAAKIDRLAGRSQEV